MQDLIFVNESLDYLLSTGRHCIHKDFIDYLKPKQELKLKNTSKNYKIAIIMPNYNNAKWLEKSIGSIAKQTYKNYELIFIDDMSTDNSVKIAKSFNIPKKIIELKQKRYNGGARNEGYLYVGNADYIYYLDSDDWFIDENVLNEINENLKGEPDVLFVGIGTNNSAYYTPNYKNRYEAIKGWSGSSGKVIKTELATKQECLYQEGTLKEDRTQHYKICLNMNTWKIYPKIVYVWNRQNSNSTTTKRDTKWKIDTIRNWADALEIYETYKGNDLYMDNILMDRVINCENEIKNGNDSQQ